MSQLRKTLWIFAHIDEPGGDAACVKPTGVDRRPTTPSRQCRQSREIYHFTFARRKFAVGSVLLGYLGRRRFHPARLAQQALAG